MQTLWVFLLLSVCSVSVCYAKHKFNKHHPVRHHPESIYCFSEEELESSPSEVVNHFVSSKMRWDKYSAVNIVNHLESAERRRKRRRRASVDSCPDFMTLESGQAMNERSISPWTYRIDTDETRYPQKLAFAHCLCNHCISSETGQETSSLNSVLVKQMMLVLRKKTCPYEPTLSTFTLEYISVPVACTCSVPRY
ncbi:interleukin-17C [Hyla sarda]|uniref:interleukin-17C n=1 Tax=Hyla sarda TaxID=327740 RepID=UPI0024C271FA|nr:interleukin-17C [Hyla sarda]